jgi:hypothetical protein
MKKATDEQIAASRGHGPSSMSKDPYGSVRNLDKPRVFGGFRTPTPVQAQAS